MKRYPVIIYSLGLFAVWIPMDWKKVETNVLYVSEWINKVPNNRINYLDKVSADKLQQILRVLAKGKRREKIRVCLTYNLVF